MIGIYQIINKFNKKSYIGKSIRIEERWYNHKNWAFNPNSKKYFYPLYQAFRKYGLDNFEFVILEECLEEELTNKEIYYYNLYKPEYCLTNPNYLNFTQTPKIREKISQALKGRKLSKEHCENMSKVRRGSKSPNAKKVIGINKKTEEKVYFDSLSEAADFLIENNLTKSSRRSTAQSISRVVTGLRKSAYGYVWIENK